MRNTLINIIEPITKAMLKLIIETTANKCDQKNDGPSFLTEIAQCPAGVNEFETKARLYKQPCLAG